MTHHRGLRAELFRRARLMWAWSRGSTHDVPGPEALLIETTTRCNLRCPMCPRTLSPPPNSDLPDEILWPLLEAHAAMGGEHVYLYGLGEPLLDPRIYDALVRCRELGLTSILSINGTLLTPARRARLLQAGVDHLIVSLDAASAATYARYRAGGEYAPTVAQVQALARERQQGQLGALVVQFVRLPGNIHEQDAFVQQWSGVRGVDHVRLKDEDIGLTEHALYEADGLSRENPCHILWRGPLVVRYTGEVFACYHHAGENVPLGNLHEDSLHDLWNGPALRALRADHAARALKPDGLCARCPAVRPRRPFVLGAIALGGATTRRLIPIAERAALKLPGLLREPRPARSTE